MPPKNKFDEKIAEIRKYFIGRLIRDNKNIPAFSSFSYEEILNFFRRNVVELIFERKLVHTGESRTAGRSSRLRRMLCTANWDFVESPTGAQKTRFGFTPPHMENRGEEWYKSKNLVIVWDIMLLEWRMVCLDNWKVISFFPLTVDENHRTRDKLKELTFVQFYRNTINDKLSESQRQAYGDKVTGDFQYLVPSKAEADELIDEGKGIIANNVVRKQIENAQKKSEYETMMETKIDAAIKKRDDANIVFKGGVNIAEFVIVRFDDTGARIVEKYMYKEEFLTEVGRKATEKLYVKTIQITSKGQIIAIYN